MVPITYAATFLVLNFQAIVVTSTSPLPLLAASRRARPLLTKQGKISKEFGEFFGELSLHGAGMVNSRAECTG